MAYVTPAPINVSEYLGLQPLTATSTIQNHGPGLLIEGMDPVYGGGQYVYAVGCTGTLVGSVVLLDQYNSTTTLAVAAGRGIVAVAMSANVANQWGWYQIYGAVPVLASGGTVGNPAYETSTAGTVSTTVVATNKIDAMICTAVPSSGFAVFELNGPQASGNG
jgi:hypothetical protein